MWQVITRTSELYVEARVDEAAVHPIRTLAGIGEDTEVRLQGADSIAVGELIE